MRRRLVWIMVAVLALTATGVGIWAWARQHRAALPEISAYSRGTTVRVGPYVYCAVTDLNDCVNDHVQGELPVGEADPVRLTVPTEISRAPWRLMQVYQDERNTTTSTFRPGAQSEVTVATVDPQRGRVVGLVVQLITLVQDETGKLHDAPHAEWSIKLVWS